MSGHSRECALAPEGAGCRCAECGTFYAMRIGTFRAQCRKYVKWPERPPESRHTQPSGPGTELKKLLRLVGITATPTCPCNARAAQMDAWGPDECETRLDEIVDWLREEAGRRRLPFSATVARQVVLLAIRRARKAAAH